MIISKYKHDKNCVTLTQLHTNHKNRQLYNTQIYNIFKSSFNKKKKKVSLVKKKPENAYYKQFKIIPINYFNHLLNH